MANANLSKEEIRLHAGIFTDGKAVIEMSICSICLPLKYANKDFTDVHCEIMKHGKYGHIYCCFLRRNPVISIGIHAI